MRLYKRIKRKNYAFWRVTFSRRKYVRRIPIRLPQGQHKIDKDGVSWAARALAGEIVREMVFQDCHKDVEGRARLIARHSGGQDA